MIKMKKKMRKNRGFGNESGNSTRGLFSIGYITIGLIVSGAFGAGGFLLAGFLRRASCIGLLVVGL